MIGNVVLVAVVFAALGLAVWGVVKLVNIAEAANQRSLERDAARANSLLQIEGFRPVLHDAGLGLAIDPEGNRFAIATIDGKPRVYDFAQLFAVEVEKDGHTVTTTKGNVNTQGAVLATLLAGPVAGLVVGAKTSSQSQSKEVTTQLTLKLYVNDLHIPVIEILFFQGYSSGGIDLTNAAKNLDAWYGRFRVIVAGNQQQQSNHTAERVFFNQTSEPVEAPPQAGWWSRTFGA